MAKKGLYLKDKVISASAAMDLIKDGDHVAIGGCQLARTPMALIMELIKKGKRNLTISRNLVAVEGDLLIAHGLLKKIITSWFGIAIVIGKTGIMGEAVASGEVELEEWSNYAFSLRYRAAAMGLPYLPTRSQLSSDIMAHNNSIVIEAPFTGEKLCLVPALEPDVALIHVQRADPAGNARIDGLIFNDADIARGAKTVILSAEEIVSTEEFKKEPALTSIPFLCVDAVVEAPMGAYPSDCAGRYYPDADHLRAYIQGARKGGRAEVRRYVLNWGESVKKAGHAQAQALAAPVRSGPAEEEALTDREILAILAARLLPDGATVFAGGGIPLIAGALARQLHAPNLSLIFEAGCLAPEIEPGLLPITGNEARTANKAPFIASVCDIFSLAQRGYADYGIIGGAQVDKLGNVNSTVAGDYKKPKARFPGSGGANDIASLCDKLIILMPHEKRRLVEKVDFVTSPGSILGVPKVYKVATELAIFGYDAAEGSLLLEAVVRGVSMKEVSEKTGFRIVCRGEPEIIELPTEKEISYIRRLDPQRLFLR